MAAGLLLAACVPAHADIPVVGIEESAILAAWMLGWTEGACTWPHASSTRLRTISASGR